VQRGHPAGRARTPPAADPRTTMATCLKRGAAGLAAWLLAAAALALAVEAAGPAAAVLNAYVGPANVATASNLTVTLADCAAGTEIFLVGVDLSGVPALHAAYDVVLPEDGAAPEADGTVTFPFVLGPKACDAAFTPAPAGIYYVALSVSTSADGAAANTTTLTDVPLVLQDLDAQPRGNDWCGRHAMVAVTQDDGPNTDPRGTTAIAASLAAMNVSAMFFVTGLDVNATDRCIRTRWLVEQGHTIGSHTYSHPDVTTLTDAELLTELVINDEWVYHCLGGLAARVFRPPYGRLTQRQMQLINSFGFSIGYWSDVIDDAPDTTPEAALAYFEAMFQAHDNAYADDDLLRPSIITNSHDYGGHLPDAFAVMVPYLRSLNYTFVTFDECLAGCGADADGLCKDPKTRNTLDRVWPYDDQSVPAPRLPWSNPACVAAADAPRPEFPSVPVDVPTRPPPPPPACVYRSQYNVLEITPSYYFNSSTCLILYDSLYTYLAELPVVNDLASLPLATVGSPKTNSFYVEGYGGAGCSTYLSYFMCTYVVDDGPPANAPCVIGADGFLTVTTANANAACVAVFSRANYTHLDHGATSGSPPSARISPYAHQGILELAVEVYGHDDCSGTLIETFSCDAYYPVTGTAPPPPTLPPTAPPTVAPPSTHTNPAAALRGPFHMLTASYSHVSIVVALRAAATARHAHLPEPERRLRAPVAVHQRRLLCRHRDRGGHVGLGRCGLQRRAVHDPRRHVHRVARSNERHRGRGGLLRHRARAAPARHRVWRGGQRRRRRRRPGRPALLISNGDGGGIAHCAMGMFHS